jgi:hypothetical protein
MGQNGLKIGDICDTFLVAVVFSIIHTNWRCMKLGDFIPADSCVVGLVFILISRKYLQLNIPEKLKTMDCNVKTPRQMFTEPQCILSRLNAIKGMRLTCEYQTSSKPVYFDSNMEKPST